MFISVFSPFPITLSDINTASLIGLVLMQTIISYLSLKSRKFNSFLCGKTFILINKGKIDQKELKKERISIDELLEQLRIQGFFNLKEVQYAILETDGNLSVVPSESQQQIRKNIICGRITSDGIVVCNA